MSYKLVWCQTPEIESVERPWLISFGNHNRPPQPMVEISEHEYYGRIYPQSRFEEHRQLTNFEGDQGFSFRALDIIWFDQWAVGRMRPRNQNEHTRYFYIGCEHVWTTVTHAMFDHTNTCSKCGVSNRVDSSG